MTIDDNIHFAYTNVCCHDKNINSPEQSLIKTYFLFNKIYKCYDKY